MRNINDLNNRLDSYDYEILEEISSARGYGYYSDDVIGNDMGKSFRINMLIAYGFIEERFTPDGRLIIRLTIRGRRSIG